MNQSLVVMDTETKAARVGKKGYTEKSVRVCVRAHAHARLCLCVCVGPDQYQTVL